VLGYLRPADHGSPSRRRVKARTTRGNSAAAFVDITATPPCSPTIGRVGARQQVGMSNGDRSPHYRQAQGGGAPATGPSPPFADEGQGARSRPVPSEWCHTPPWHRNLPTFVRDICGCTGDGPWPPFRARPSRGERARRQRSRHLRPVRRGDSSVVAALMHERGQSAINC